MMIASYKRLLCISIMLLWLLPLASLHAQSTPVPRPAPNYQTRVLANATLSDDQTTFTIRLAVLNIGTDATQNAVARIYDIQDNTRTIAQTTVTPLRFSEVREVEISFPVRPLPPGERVILGVEVIPPEEATDTLLDNRTSFGVDVPLYEVQSGQPPAIGQSPSQTQPTSTQAPLPVGVFQIPLVNIIIDLNDTNQRLILAGILIAGLVLLFLTRLIFRALFNRPPLFGSYKTAYADSLQYDRNSTMGRRQLWQNHAQNNTAHFPCRMGTYHARKLLLGMNGQYLDGWRITAMRMMQYDSYGRINRSLVLAQKRWIRKLDRLAHRGAKLKPHQLKRRVAPIAKGMAKQFKKRISRKSALLAIALDVRFVGKHGEIRIVFELHECQQGMPALLDQWEPEMSILGRTLYESYTFTLVGQNNTETYRQFRKRLPGDIQQALVNLCLVMPVVRHEALFAPPNFLNPPTHQPTASPPTPTGLPRVSVPTPTSPITQTLIETPTENNLSSFAPPLPLLDAIVEETQQHNPMQEEDHDPDKPS